MNMVEAAEIIAILGILVGVLILVVYHLSIAKYLKPSSTNNDIIVIRSSRGYELRTYKAVPNDQRMKCSTCKYLRGYVSWWCENQDAIEDRNSALPTAINCPHWDHPCFISN